MHNSILMYLNCIKILLSFVDIVTTYLSYHRFFVVCTLSFHIYHFIFFDLLHLSTTVATYSLLKEILDALNSNSVVGGIFCDLKKAFDHVNHDILLLKMEFYGIKGIFNRLVKSY